MTTSPKTPENKESEDSDADAAKLLNGETTCANKGKPETSDLLEVEQVTSTDCKVIWKVPKEDNPKSKITNFCGTIMFNKFGRKIFAL